jgi:Rho-type GTPase-activating protein 1/2
VVDQEGLRRRGGNHRQLTVEAILEVRGNYFRHCGPSIDYLTDALNIPQFPNNSRHSSISQKSEAEGADADEFLIPVAFDPTPPAQSSPHLSNHRTPRGETRDYFGAAKTGENVPRKPSGGTPTSPVGTPHIAYQEKGRVTSEEIIDSIKKRRDGSFSANGSATTSPIVGSDQTRQQYATSPKVAQNSRGMSSEERFKLQEVPKAKRSGGSARSSKSGPTSPPSGTLPTLGGQNHRLEKSGEMLTGNTFVVQEPESFATQNISSSAPSQDYRLTKSESMDSSRSGQASTIGQLKYPPKRGDSLESSKVGQSIPRKEVSTAPSKLQDSPKIAQDLSSASTAPTMASEYAGASEKTNGGKVISRPFESPQSKSVFDTSVTRKADASSNLNGSFVASRAPPSQPVENQLSRHETSSTSQSDTLKTGERPITPGLPRCSAGGEFSMEEDMARILGGEESQGHESFLRRVSNSVRHGRSFSDKGLRSSREPKWPRSPTANMSVTGQEISSPITASPEHRDELAWVKNELRRERQRTIERDQRITELESTLHSQANIKQANTELREKRSTIVVLDTRKEMVVRELEVLTEHIVAAKKSGDPLDLSKMTHTVMRDFAESLQKLKDSFAPQIEEFVQKRNDLVDELSNLTQMKDKSFLEFEQLSLKNAQLAELNNQLVHQIQELYKANSGAHVEQSREAPNGLGIYSHHKDKSQVSIDSREARPNPNEMSWTSGTTLQQEEAEPVTVLQGPHVVNIRKGQPRKFNWKKGGQNVAKGVTKGIKVAFSSTQASYSREMQFAETTPYGATPPGNDHATNPLRHGPLEPPRPGFVLFGGNQRPAGKGHQNWKPQSNGSSPALTIDASTSKSSTYS